MICSFNWPASSAIYLFISTNTRQWKLLVNKRTVRIHESPMRIHTHKRVLDNIAIQVQHIQVGWQVQEPLGPSSKGELVGHDRDLCYSWNKMRQGRLVLQILQYVLSLIAWFPNDMEHNQSMSRWTETTAMSLVPSKQQTSKYLNGFFFISLVVRKCISSYDSRILWRYCWWGG